MIFLAETDRMGAILENAPAGKFSYEAYSLLSQVPFHRMFSPSILNALRERHASHSHRLEHDCVFSDECLVLYVGENFTIEIYHWLYSDTGIHDHNFNGAFQCLAGEDHQVEFKFHPEREIFEGLEAGKLVEVTNKIIRPGDTQEIRNEDHFIHAVAHAPSTWNICIRTKGDQEQTLKAYHTAGYRYALRKDREEKLLEKELSKINPGALDSTDLLHLFHMLGTKSGHHEIRKTIDALLNERHQISYMEIMDGTSKYLNDLGRVAKDY